jgi:hypothetical protein
MGGKFFAKDKIQSVLSGCYFFTDCNTVGSVRSLCIYRAYVAYMKLQLIQIYKEIHGGIEIW